MPHAEIAAFAHSYDLPPVGVAELEALVARLSRAALAPSRSGSLVRLPPRTGVAEEEETPAVAGAAAIPARYQDLGLLGVGGMGEVRRVRDLELGRTCAFKVIRADLVSKSQVVSRFVEEAQVAAQLQHPNLPPVYDAGTLPDGRAWFTMKEIRGRTLSDVIAEVHAASADGSWRAGPSGWTLHRMVDAFAKVCDAVGYAHARGVVHRDLKPDNVMAGAHGEILVLDWGIAKILGRATEAGAADEEDAVASVRSADESQKTRMGGVMGTAAYMPPEQARGLIDQLDARADVYALGAILYQILGGRPPYEGRDARAVLRQVLTGPPEPLGRKEAAQGRSTFLFDLEAEVADDGGLPLPEELVALCARCMEREPGDRPADGAVVAAEARAWLDGARRREKALELVDAAERVVAERAALQERAGELRAEGDALLVSLEPWAPEEEKDAAWSLQDDAERKAREAQLLELSREALLQGALTHDPELPEAHAALADLELDRHRAAEDALDAPATARAHARLLQHAESLPDEHAVRRRAATYLRGDGAVSLATDPPGATIDLYRYEVRHRRLVAVPVRELGRTPLRAVPLPMGSYLCRIRHPDREDVAYPVFLRRGEHWDGVAPDGRRRAIHLPERGALGADERLVPAGWFWSGGDAEAVDSLPRRRLWCDAFVVQRFPVTCGAYLAFLDDLAATGRQSEALRHVPRERAAAGEGPPVFVLGAEGRFVARADAPPPDAPITLVDWFGAAAYAAWLAARTGRPWRLLGQLEWEKAARGVDGRAYPWGDAFDPSWCRVRASYPGAPTPAVVDSYPVDESAYGVRGLGGNVEDWCADVYRREGPLLDGLAVVPPDAGEAADPAAARVRRGGGFFFGSSRDARAAGQARIVPGNRYEFLGFRLGYRPAVVGGGSA